MQFDLLRGIGTATIGSVQAAFSGPIVYLFAAHK